MEQSYFPMFVDISKMKIIVAGGGKIAARRVKTLTQFAGNITVIAPEIAETLKELETAGEIRCLHRAYQKEDIADAHMVLAATDDKELNHSIAAQCRDIEHRSGRKIWVNVADDKSLCDFYFPSVIRRDKIVVGINSGGDNPGNVKKLRERLEKEL
ncbi:MAG: bifunctional precorrin-2 dehydrogenase/sirohydrochlorin ferrochelatase [Muricomes sp.]